MNTNIKYALITFGAICVLGPLLAPNPETKFFLAIPSVIFWYFIGAYVYEKLKENNKNKRDDLVRNNPLLAMSIKELDQRAYAELKSEHYSVSLGFLNELIDARGRELFRFYNMRAECYLNLNNNQSAMLDALRSVELEADINKNKKGYEIRNMLLKQGS